MKKTIAKKTTKKISTAKKIAAKKLPAKSATKKPAEKDVKDLESGRKARLTKMREMQPAIADKIDLSTPESRDAFAKSLFEKTDVINKTAASLKEAADDLPKISDQRKASIMEKSVELTALGGILDAAGEKFRGQTKPDGLSLEESLSEIVAFAKMLEDVDMEKELDGTVPYFKHVGLAAAETLSSITKSINDSHKYLQSFERSYAKLKADAIADERVARLALENITGDKQALEDAFYLQLRSKHKLLMIDKVYDEALTQFDRAKFEQDDVHLVSLKEEFDNYFTKQSPTPETIEAARKYSEDRRKERAIAEQTIDFKSPQHVKQEICKNEMKTTGTVGRITRSKR